MNRNFSLAVASLFIASPAFAGSMAPVVTEQPPMVSAPMPAMAPAWTGGYVGANLSYGEGSLDASGDTEDALTGLGLSSNLSEPDGYGGSIRAGYDWQFGRGVFGLGLDYNFGEYEGALDGDTTAALALPDTDFTIDEVATVFARAGYAVSDQFLAYGLLGFSRATGTLSTAADSESDDLEGITAGIGGEYRFTQNWSTYVEYNYTDFGDIDDSDFDVELHQVKLGVNYRF